MIDIKETLETSNLEPFIVKESSLEYLFNHLQTIPNGVIILCLSGTAKICVNFESHWIEKNMQIFMLPNSTLSITSRSEDFQVIYFAFSGSMMNDACYLIGSELPEFLKKNSFHFFPQEIFEKKYDFLKLLGSFYEDRNNNFRLKIATNFLQNYLWDIFDKIARHLTRVEILNLGRKNELFKQFVKCIHTNFRKVREVSFYAGELSISTRYLSKITHDIDNRSAKEIIDSYVIQEIKLLLHSPDASIQQIADTLNFPDQSYLGRFFKSKTGISPSEYRKKQ
jgi:AraC-like DNA-binding protein